MKRDHLNTEAIHHCVPCGKHFVDLGQLKAHNYQSHGEREKCLKCEKTFLTKVMLKKHLVFDHNIKDGALFCDRCPKKVFFKEAILQVHLKKKHNLLQN
jgi:DNA-directed RNA polymerase subunit RPC12/RpoP